jgi:hypothetical protein
MKLVISDNISEYIISESIEPVSIFNIFISTARTSDLFQALVITGFSGYTSIVAK